MIISLLVAVTAFIFFLRVFCGDWLGLFGNIGMAVLALLCAIVVFIFMGAVCAAISMDLVHEDMVVMGKGEVTEIVAIRDGNSVDGVLFLGCGHKDGDFYYCYAEESEQRYSIQNVRAEECRVKYTDTTPRIVRQTADGFKNKWNYILLFPIYEKTTIYVPPGSIDMTFNIDL